MVSNIFVLHRTSEKNRKLKRVLFTFLRKECIINAYYMNTNNLAFAGVFNSDVKK